MSEDNLEGLVETRNLKETLGELNPVYLQLKELVETLFCDPEHIRRIVARILINRGMNSVGFKLLAGVVIDKQIFFQVEEKGERTLWYITEVPRGLNGEPNKTYSFMDPHY